MEEVRELMLRKELGDIHVRYLGDKAVLLTANKGTQMENIIAENNEYMAEIF